MLNQPMLAAALSYIQRGWEVFPVPRGTKMGHSVRQRGFNNGKPWGKTKDEAEVRAYWCRLPRANIGVAMGAASGIFDVECDTKAGHSNLKQDGAASLAALEQQHGQLPDTLMFESPSGSLHRLIQHPGGDFRVEHSVSKLGEGIDVIGDGFMSVMPPSTKPGKGSYRWINDLPVASAPAWLLELVHKEERPPYKPTSDNDEVSIDRLTLALALVPNDDLDWVNWNRIALAIWRATNGNSEGYRLFAAWSAKSTKCGGKEQPADTWKRISGCPPKVIGGPTIFYLANEAVPNWQCRLVGDPEIDAMIDAFFELMDDVT